MTARKETRNMGKLRKEFRNQCQADDAPCWLCGMKIDYDAPHNDYGNDDRFELDHLYPVSIRPDLQEDPANFRASHSGCNRERGNGDPAPELGILSRAWV